MNKKECEKYRLKSWDREVRRTIWLSELYKWLECNKDNNIPIFKDF